MFDRLATQIQTFPVITRDGKSYGRMILTCGARQIRIIAEGDQDLIEAVYSETRTGPSAPAAAPSDGADGQLFDSCRTLLRLAASGDQQAIDRIAAIIRAAAMGDADCFAIYCALQDLSGEVI